MGDLAEFAASKSAFYYETPVACRTHALEPVARFKI
jgi:hypothetical protein